MSKKYFYFVSYFYRVGKTTHGYGMAEVECDKLINKFDDLKSIAEEHQEGLQAESLTILNFILLREESSNG